MNALLSDQIDSLGDVLDRDIIKIIQDIYASEMDLSTNVLNAGGRLNVVSPSNLVPLCSEIVRGIPTGMHLCKESDRRGREILVAVLNAQSPEDIESIRKRYPEFESYIPLLPSTGPADGNGATIVAVVYRCPMGFVDFAIPIFRNGDPKQGLISVAYGGQYMPGDRSLEEQVPEFLEILQETLHLEDPCGVVEGMLKRSRQVSWPEIATYAHVIYALGNAMALIGEQHSRCPEWDTDQQVLRIYFAAARMMCGADDGCIVLHDRWRNEFKFPSVPCQSFEEATCHRNSGRLFARLVQNQSLYKLSLPVKDEATTRWWIKSEGVEQNHVFAIRNSHRDLLGLLNLNYLQNTGELTDFQHRVVSHIVRQIAVYLEINKHLIPERQTIERTRHLNRIVQTLPLDTGKLCTEVTEALSQEGPSSGGKRKCLVWLVDRADDSEEQQLRGSVGEKHYFLTCYAFSKSDYPGNSDAERFVFQDIADIPLAWDKLEAVIEKSIMSPRELCELHGEIYDALLKTKVLAEDPSAYQVMVLPIMTEHDPKRQYAGVLMIVDTITGYLTEEDRETYLQFCYRMKEALTLIAERSRSKTEQSIRDFPLTAPEPYTRAEMHRRLRKYLQQVVSAIHKVVDCEGVSVFLRETYPEHDPEDNEPIVLWAAENVRAHDERGFPMLWDDEAKCDISVENFHKIRYSPDADTCTGYSLTMTVSSMRISDLDKHNQECVRREKAGETPILPHWRGRWGELIDNLFTPHRGVICVQLRSKSGKVIGILRASTRRDHLRFTRFDEDTMNLIALVVAEKIEAFTYECRLARRNQSLSTMVLAVENILKLDPDQHDYPKSLQRSVLLPLVLPHGLNFGRAAYCEVDKNGIWATVGIGGISEEENAAVRQLAAQYGDHLYTSKRQAMFWEELSTRHITRFRDTFYVKARRETLKGSLLEKALRCGTYQIVTPASCEHEIDKSIRDIVGGNAIATHTFAYIPVVGLNLAGIRTNAFIYLDSPFTDDEEICDDSVNGIKAFAAVLGGIWSAVELRKRANDVTFHFSHEVGNVLSSVMACANKMQDTQVSLGVGLANYRAKAVLQVFDPKRRDLEHDVGNQSVDLDASLARLVPFYRSYISNQGLTCVTLMAPSTSRRHIRGSESFLDAVLGQLLENAVKFVAYEQNPEGRVGIEILEPVPIGDHQYLPVEVWDTGPGMPPDAPREFDRIYQGEHNAGGTGIGLLTCKKLLDAWVPELADSGELNLSHRPNEGGGTRFRVLLPLYEPNG